MVSQFEIKNIAINNISKRIFTNGLQGNLTTCLSICQVKSGQKSKFKSIAKTLFLFLLIESATNICWSLHFHLSKQCIVNYTFLFSSLRNTINFPFAANHVKTTLLKSTNSSIKHKMALLTADALLLLWQQRCCSFTIFFCLK